MTLGEKIKEARTELGFSQQNLADKLNVSRSAVAKWETDKGVPDLENLKRLAKLFGQSVDSLLSIEGSITEIVSTEKFVLSSYGKGLKKKKKDKAMREKFPNAKIHPLLGRQKLTKGERVLDNLLGIFTDIPFGTADLFNSFKHLDKEFYLVEENGKQFLVTVTDDFIQTRLIKERIAEEVDKFDLGIFTFIKCKYELKE